MVWKELIEARERKVWTQSQLAQKVSVAENTVQRWESGESKPQNKHMSRLMEVLSVDVVALGLVNEPMTIQRDNIDVCGTIYEDLFIPIILWDRGKTKYEELQDDIHTRSEGPMNEERREAIKVIARIPVGLFALSEDRALQRDPGEMLPWIAAGIVAARRLSYSSDLISSDQMVAKYLPTLLQITNNPDYRKEAARLTNQAYTIRAVMAWHLHPLNAIYYAQQAEKYSIIANNTILQAHTMRITSWAYFYGRNYQAAMQKMLEAQEFVKINAVPDSIKSRIYLELARYQGFNGLIDDAKRSMRCFYDHRSVQGILITGGYDSEFVLLQQEGEALAASALHHSNKQEAKALHNAALECYEQSSQATNKYGERYRVELLNNTLVSKLSQPSPDKAECIKLWADAISSAQLLKSEQRFMEAIFVLAMMQGRWAGEQDIMELGAIATHW